VRGVGIDRRSRITGERRTDRPPGHYCMTWDIGGSNCSFTSYDQCLATAAGLDAECYGKTAGDDREDSTFPSTRAYDSRAYNSRAQMR
jgi:hypothetical protein